MGAIIDRHTVTVTYDKVRGEPRGKAVRQAAGEAARGDCVDCGQCITVCPTGIDIRNGIQLECVNCTACIDACDSVMTRLKRPLGLIRLTSHEALERPGSSWLTTRVKAYAAVWALLLTAVVTLIVIRPDLDVLILRQPGTLYATLDEGAVGNFYNVQVINRTNRAHTLEYRAIQPLGATITALGPVGQIAPHGLVESRLLLRIPKDKLTAPSLPVRFEVRSNGELLETIDSSFLGPTPAP
jgi:cytochrome c oxidase accessory protein FixG